MLYWYKCLSCKSDASIKKPMSESSRKEHCKICKTELTRVYNTTAIKTSDGYKG